MTGEVDRCIVLPGQALAYKIGRQKILELRNYATQEPGAKFDALQFHNEVLGHGSLPLDTLEQGIMDWVVERKRTN